MALIDLLSFDEALKHANASFSGKEPNLSVLLGNGFSRAYKNDIFSYDALLTRAVFKKHGVFLRRVFANLKTSDFERVIRLFVDMRLVLESISRRPVRVINFLKDVERLLKEALADTLAQAHPDGPFAITDEEYATVRSFLQNFKDIYTLNYDLLLYWALMHKTSEALIAVDDGFRNPDEIDAEYVTWEPENRLRQCVHYLHGALHIFDSGYEIKKYTWCRTGVRLKDQILAELNCNTYPLIITEGRSTSKKDRIFHNIYLASSYKSLIGKGGCLFIYGASLQEHDEHIVRALKENRKLKSVYFGVYGDPNSATNASSIARVLTLADPPLPKSVSFFDAKSIQVWR